MFQVSVLNNQIQFFVRHDFTNVKEKEQNKACEAKTKYFTRKIYNNDGKGWIEIGQVSFKIGCE